MPLDAAAPFDIREVRHFHVFCGIAGGARGFNRGSARVGNMQAVFRCLGGVDVSAPAIRDFERLAGVPGTVLDLFTIEQYIAFHGCLPPPGWRLATPQDIQRAAGYERPHIVFLSAPCKGFSGLLSESRSLSDKYQALNQLALRGVWLTLEAFQDDPPELILFENVLRISRRGRALLDQIVGLLRSYGYAVAETTHDCGELGSLAQTRRRFLLVARHQEKVPPFLYEPPKRPLRAVGDVVGRLPLPGDTERGGPMHRVPMLQWRTWLRLAFVEAGSDWRSLNRLKVEDGHLADYLVVPDTKWEGGGRLGVTDRNQPSVTVAGASRPENGRFSVADPRHMGPAKFSNVFRIVPWTKPGTAVTSSRDVCVADPRTGWPDGTHATKFRVHRYGGPASAVTGSDRVASGAMCVADPRPNMRREKGDAYVNGGHYGVLGWSDTAHTVCSAGQHDNGAWSIADPRDDAAPLSALTHALPAAQDRLVAMVRSMDGTWHRPFTTLEMAALQSLVDPDEYLELDGESDAAWRDRIGNAVPPDAAEAIANTMGTTLLLAWAGESFMLSAMPIWVRPVAVGLSIRQPVSAPA